MSWSYDPISRIASARKALEARDVVYPKQVQAALGLVDQIRDRRPAAPSDSAVMDGYLSGANNEALLQAATREAMHACLVSAHDGALKTASRRALTAILDAGDALVEQLRQLAEAQIEAIQRVANLDQVDLPTLLAAGRTEDATAVAGLAAASTALQQLYGLRDAFLWPKDVANINGVDCSVWTDSTVVEHHLASVAHHLDNVYLMGLRKGATLWWPTLEEAIAAAQPIAAHRGIELEQKRLIHRAQGHVSGAVMA